MDGHKRPDVVEYRNETFLHLMESHQKKMVTWELEGSELVRIDPVLSPGKKRIVALFQDESSFHANEYKRTIWCVLELPFPREHSHDLRKGSTRPAKTHEEREGPSYSCVGFYGGRERSIDCLR